MQIQSAALHNKREMLAAILRVERFQMYVYGRSFTIESNHKPLESISQKNLADTPSCLQHMLLCIQGYDYTIYYHPGKEMAMPDTLSCFNPHPALDIPLDIATHHALLSPERKESFQQAFVSNPKMHALTDMIITSWPDNNKAVPHPLCPYWQHGKTLTMEDGLVLCGEALFIPLSERERILQQLHQFHQGTTKGPVVCMWMCLLARHKQSHRRRSSAVWDLHPVPSPKCCSTPHTMPTLSYPWQMCTTDIFTLEGINYLICSNFYSKMILIWCLPSGQSNNGQSCLTAQRNVLGAQNSQSTLVWQWPSVWECTDSLSSAPLGVSHTRPQAPTTHNWMDLQRCAWNLWSMHSNVLSTVALTHSLPFWCSEQHPSVPSSCYLLSSCTNARLGPPFLPESATPTQQPSRFMNELMPAQMPPSHRQTNAADLLHPTMLASPLQCMTPSHKIWIPATVVRPAKRQLPSAHQ